MNDIKWNSRNSTNRVHSEHRFGGKELEQLKELYFDNLEIFKKLFKINSIHKEFCAMNEPESRFRDLYCWYTFVFIKYSELKFENEEGIKLIRELFNSGDKENMIIGSNMLMNLKLKK